MIVGGHGKRVLERVLAYGDEWMPNRIGDDERISARIARLRKAGEESGRGPIPTTLANATTDPGVLELYESSGVHRALFWVRTAKSPTSSAGSTGSRPGSRPTRAPAEPQSCEASSSSPSSERPVSSQVGGATSMCWVAAWTSRKRRSSGPLS